MKFVDAFPYESVKAVRNKRSVQIKNLYCFKLIFQYYELILIAIIAEQLAA